MEFLQVVFYEENSKDPSIAPSVSLHGAAINSAA